MTQKGNAKAAYEGILVISQQPTTIINETTRNVINQEINQNTRVDTDIRIVFRDPCIENPDLPECPVDCEANPDVSRSDNIQELSFPLIDASSNMYLD